MDQVCYDKVKAQLHEENNSGNKNQILIFVHSRNDTYKTAKMLLEKSETDGEMSMFLDSEDLANKEILTSEIEKNRGINQKLKEVLSKGVGIHHAGKFHIILYYFTLIHRFVAY